MRRTFPRIPGSPQAIATVETPAHYMRRRSLLQFGSFVRGGERECRAYMNFVPKNTAKLQIFRETLAKIIRIQLPNSRLFHLRNVVFYNLLDLQGIYSCEKDKPFFLAGKELQNKRKLILKISLLQPRIYGLILNERAVSQICLSGGVSGLRTRKLIHSAIGLDMRIAL